MNPEVATLIQAVASILSVLVAVTALAIAFRVEARNSVRFQDQQNLTKEIALANIRPVLAAYTLEYINLKGLTLSNCGVGTAVITDVEFSKNGRTVKNVAKLFSFDKPVIWDTYWTFLKAEDYLRAGDKRALVKLSKGNLVKQGFTEEQALHVLESWQEQLDGITLAATYQNILGNEQEAFEHTFSS